MKEGTKHFVLAVVLIVLILATVWGVPRFLGPNGVTNAIDEVEEVVKDTLKADGEAFLEQEGRNVLHGVEEAEKALGASDGLHSPENAPQGDSAAKEGA